MKIGNHEFSESEYETVKRVLAAMTEASDEVDKNYGEPTGNSPLAEGLRDDRQAVEIVGELLEDYNDHS